jgi:hypothetical protein
MRIVRLSRPTPAEEQFRDPEPDDDFEWLQENPSEWEEIIDDLVITARRIAVHFKCAIRQAIKHWPAFLNCEQVSKGSRSRSMKVAETFWPTERQWKLAIEKQGRAWQIESLFEAARELDASSKKITAANLMPRLFRNPEAQREYRNYQVRREDVFRAEVGEYRLFETYGQRLAFETRPNGYQRALYSRPDPRFGERGISRAEFFKRYDRHDIEDARIAARKAGIPNVVELARFDPDEFAEMTILDNRLRPIL